MKAVPYLDEFKTKTTVNKDWVSFITYKVSNVILPEQNKNQDCHISSVWHNINVITRRCLTKTPEDRSSAEDCVELLKKKINMGALPLNNHQGTALADAQGDAVRGTGIFFFVKPSYNLQSPNINIE